MDSSAERSSSALVGPGRSPGEALAECLRVAALEREAGGAAFAAPKPPLWRRLAFLACFGAVVGAGLFHLQREAGGFARELVACDDGVPGLDELPEHLQNLFYRRRALRLSDAEVQKELDALPDLGQSPSERLWRFYLLYDPVLNVMHMASRLPSEALRSQVEAGLEEVAALPVDRRTRQLLTARLMTSRWLLDAGDPARTDAAWTAARHVDLEGTQNGLDLQIFILERLAATAPLSGKVWLDGAWRQTESLRSLRERLAARRYAKGGAE